VTGHQAVTELLTKLENRLIFIRHGPESAEHLEAVDELGGKMTSLDKLGVKPY